MEIQAFFDPATYTLTYLVFDPQSHDAVVIDPVLDYDPESSQTSAASLDRVSKVVRDNDLRLHYVLETHAHADHLSGSQALRRRHDAKVAIGARIVEVQVTFKAFFAREDLRTDGGQFDRLLEDGERLTAGTLEIQAIATPGHTPACVTYRIGDALFTGDALFIEDYGVGRCDFPRGSAEDLYTSVHDKLYALADDLRVFVGHDYMPGGRPLRYETTLGREKRENVQLRRDTSRSLFVELRTARDRTLRAPRLLLPSVQINVDAGRLPPRRDDEKRYLHIPINAFAPTDECGEPERR
jgi:glyoxylase-like metal-dependent hydrolase (beta-lactamase superfamily II)